MFRTELNIIPSLEKIEHGNKIITIGSCFSQVIGERLSKNKFETLVNPFGTIFNPVSIFRLLENSISSNFSILSSSVLSQSIWFNYHVHSDLYGDTEEELKSRVEEKVKEVNQWLNQADVLIITLGTAFVYKLNSNREIVANCHKQPSSNFTKELLTVDEIIKTFIFLFDQLKIQNSKLKIILTVSPVRHTKDTLQLNSVSKSILRVACHELSNCFSAVTYFPSYELMIDDLRDYRFYKEDMIHPTEVAEEYIWNKFSETYFKEETKEIIKEWSSVYKALRHKPFRENSEEYKKFLNETLKKLELLKGKINVQEEIDFLRDKINI